ncbi:MAG: BON domain-containing protein [Pseudomonadota bacterium]
MKMIKTLSTLVLPLAFLLATGCASTDTQHSVGEVIDDTVITTKVKAALVSDADLKATEIGVETYKGVVQLSGFVAESGDINKAGTLARSIDGVQSVKNDIRTK